MIEKMENKYEKELTDFLYEHIRLKEYFIAWIPEAYQEISSLDKDNFILCIENGMIVGCIGTYISHEQEVARLLGPIIEQKYFCKYIDVLFKKCLQGLPEDINELRVAFYKENILCKRWCERNGFQLYNAETTMFYNKELFSEQEVPSSVSLKFYEPKYKKGLELAHPKGTFFTLDEMIGEISPYHHLLLAVAGDEVLGYVYYERTEDRKLGEIELLHVKEGKRCRGCGTALLKTAIKELLSENVEQISISVRVDNFGAQKLYRRIGFTDRDTVYAYKKSIDNQLY